MDSVRKCPLRNSSGVNKKLFRASFIFNIEINLLYVRCYCVQLPVALTRPQFNCLLIVSSCHGNSDGSRAGTPCIRGTQRDWAVTSGAVPWIRSLVAGLSPWRPGFAPGSIHMGFLLGKVAPGQVLLWILLFFPVSIIPPSLSKFISSGECVIC
jgi:hypothetical protein